MRRIAVAAYAVLLAVLILVSTAARAQLANTPWPMFHHGPTHTGLSPYDTSGNNGTKKWAFATNIIEESSPAIAADGTIYIGSGDHNLYALNPNGTQKWAFLTSSDLESSSPAIGTDGTIYVLAFDGNLYALNADGTQKWVLSLGSSGSSLVSSPTIGPDGTIYVGITSTSGFLVAVADTTCSGSPCGTVKWEFPAFERVASSPAVGGNGTIYFGSATNLLSGDLFALNPDGTQKWEFTANGVDSSPAVGADGTIYFGDNGGTFYAVTDTICDGSPCGKQKWLFNSESRILSCPAIGADGTIYIGSANGTVSALTDGGLLKWSFGAGSNFVASFTSSPAVGGDGTIYFGSPDDNLYALNPDGTEKWAFATGAFVQSSPAIGPDGTIYIGSSDNNLYAIGGPPTTVSVPATLAFVNSPVGDTVTKNLTVKNTGHKPLFMGSVTSSDSAEFAATGTTTCPSGGLAPGLTCTIAIGFTPSALGARSATLSVNDNTPTSPQHVALTGTGTVTMTVAPVSYGFGSVKDGSKAIKVIVVHNYQTNSVSLGESFSGPNLGDFSVTGGTCTSTLAKASVCTLIVTFAPTGVGSESATMTVMDSPDPLGPYTVSFTALATVPESLSATKLIFGNVYRTASKTLNLTVTNKATSGAITLTGTSIGGANPGDFAVTGGSCGGSLAAASSCTYAVTFTPGTETAESGTLSISVAEDPNGGPPVVALSGTGLTPLIVVPASIAFGTIANGHSSTNRTVTVINEGGAAVSLSESVTGANPSDFVPTGGTCESTLSGGRASCTYTLKFTPSIVGAESATLGVSAAGDAASPHNVSLGGTGS